MRIGLPLLLLTSLSLHVIALLIIMLLQAQPRGAGRGHEPEPPGTVIILSKDISLDRPSQSAFHPISTPAPPLLAPAIARSQPPPVPKPEVSANASTDTMVAGGGGPDLTGGVVFLLDISGSMYEPYAGYTRLAIARKFLRGQIEALPDGTPFAIAMYGETTRHSGRLVRATPASRAAAEQYLMQDFNCGGGTNLPAGFDTAEDLRPASIVLVTDGDLNINTRELLKETRRILGQPGPQLSVFGVAPRAGTVDEHQLEEIARQQSGSYHPMDVRH